MQVFTDKPLGFFGRLKAIQAAYVLRDMGGWWRVLLFGRTGRLPDNFAELVDAVSTTAALTQHIHLTSDELAAVLAVLKWVPKPVEFEWFVSEQTVGPGILVEAYIDTQLRELEHDGWRVESWLHPTQTHRRRLVVHACRRLAEPKP
jgi:hypothetical protein